MSVPVPRDDERPVSDAPIARSKQTTKKGWAKRMRQVNGSTKNLSKKPGKSKKKLKKRV